MDARAPSARLTLSGNVDVGFVITAATLFRKLDRLGAIVAVSCYQRPVTYGNVSLSART